MADEEDGENDIGCENRGRDRNVAEVLVKLEGQEEHVEPGDLRDHDGVSDREGCVQDALGVNENVVQEANVVVCASDG